MGDALSSRGRLIYRLMLSEREYVGDGEGRVQSRRNHCSGRRRKGAANLLGVATNHNTGSSQNFYNKITQNQNHRRQDEGRRHSEASGPTTAAARTTRTDPRRMKAKSGARRRRERR